MESRTTFRFETKKPTDYQVELENESGYDLSTKEVSSTSISVTCVPQAGGVPLRIDYSLRINAPKSVLTVYTAVNVLADGGMGFVTTDDEFVFKAGTKAEGLHPWIAEKRTKHTKLFEQNRLPGKVGAAGFGRAFALIWDGVRLALDEQHQKKSKAKDKRDLDSGELF
jgi:hypothetical protein